jgi:hypothetical protein
MQKSKTRLKKVELEEASSSTPSEEPRTKSAAIYQALLELGDPNAPASDVREHVLKRWPALRESVETEKHWTSYVTQNRDRAARELGVERTRRRGRRPKTARAPAGLDGAEPVTVGDILSLGRIRRKLKDENDLAEVVTLVAGLGPASRVEMILDRYVELMKRHGEDAESVEQFLRDVQELGLAGIG